MEKALNKFLQELARSKKISVSKISDGYHSFEELYDHRNLLFITLARLFKDNNAVVWKSLKNRDGKGTPGWFVMGIDYMAADENTIKQISYHLPMSLWKYCKFASTMNKSPWNGHASKDVIEQLIELLKHD